jgi:hypothetical protein
MAKKSDKVKVSKRALIAYWQSRIQSCTQQEAIGRGLISGTITLWTLKEITSLISFPLRVIWKISEGNLVH